MTDTIYFIIKEPNMCPRIKRPGKDVEAFAKELVAHYPKGTVIIHVNVREDDLWIEDVDTWLATVEGYRQLAEAQREIDTENNALMDRIKEDFGAQYASHIRDCLTECEAPAGHSRLEIVEKPSGRAQAEDWGSFKEVFVQQWSVGCEGDSFEGYICIPLPDGKFLKSFYST